MTATTPVFQFEYPVAGEPVGDFRAVFERTIKKVDSALAPRTLNTNIASLNDETTARQAADSNLTTSIGTTNTNLNALVAALQTAPPVDLAFYAGGANFGSGYRNVCFWRTYKTVFVAGMAKIVGSLAAGAGVQLVGLPAGYRPSATVPAPVLVNGTGAGRLDVQTGGDIVLTNTSATAYSAGSYVPINLVVPLP